MLYTRWRYVATARIAEILLLVAAGIMPARPQQKLQMPTASQCLLESLAAEQVQYHLENAGRGGFSFLGQMSL